MRARRDLPSPYRGAGRGHAAPFSPNRRHPVPLAPFACSKLQAVDIYPFEGQGLPTTTAGAAAKKAARPALPRAAQRCSRPARPRILAVPVQAGTASPPCIPLNNAKPCRKNPTPRLACASGPATSDTLIVREWGHAWVWIRAQAALVAQNKKKKKEILLVLYYVDRY